MATDSPRLSVTRRAAWLHCLLAGWFLCWAIFFAVKTLHWREVNDPAQITYLAWLVDHGFAPYRYLLEMNMPGIYITNWSVLHLFGPGSLAWRCFDLGLLTAATVAMIVIARPYGWFGGLFAGVLFALFHGHDGPAQQGQRDFIIAVLLVCGYAALFTAVRRSRPWPLLFFGLCAGAAATIKPPALVFAVLLCAVACWQFRAERGRLQQAAFLSLVGVAIPLLVVLGWLVKHGSLQAFLETSRLLLPYYARLGRRPVLYLLHACFTPSLVTLLGFASVLGLCSHRSWNWERTLLVGGIAFGAFSEFAQGKGWFYHRYPLAIFVFLWAGVEMSRALRTPLSIDVPFAKTARTVATACLLYGIVLAPLSAREAVRRTWDEAYNQALTADLQHLGGSQLSGSVQCITMPADCATTLYRMRLLQATGLVYDYWVFGDSREPAIQYSRRRFWSQLLQKPPRVIILGRFLYPYTDDDYNKLLLWPEFHQYLDAHYSIYDDRRFAYAMSGIRGYRIYVRNP